MEKIIYLTREEIKNLENAGYIFDAGKDRFLFLDWEFEDFVVRPDLIEF